MDNLKNALLSLATDKIFEKRANFRRVAEMLESHEVTKVIHINSIEEDCSNQVLTWHNIFRLLRSAIIDELNKTDMGHISTPVSGTHRDSIRERFFAEAFSLFKVVVRKSDEIHLLLHSNEIVHFSCFLLNSDTLVKYSASIVIQILLESILDVHKYCSELTEKSWNTLLESSCSIITNSHLVDKMHSFRLMGTLVEKLDSYANFPAKNFIEFFKVLFTKLDIKSSRDFVHHILKSLDIFTRRVFSDFEYDILILRKDVSNKLLSIWDKNCVVNLKNAILSFFVLQAKLFQSDAHMEKYETLYHHWEEIKYALYDRLLNEISLNSGRMHLMQKNPADVNFCLVFHLLIDITFRSGYKSCTHDATKRTRLEDLSPLRVVQTLGEKVKHSKHFILHYIRYYYHFYSKLSVPDFDRWVLTFLINIPSDGVPESLVKIYIECIEIFISSADFSLSVVEGLTLGKQLAKVVGWKTVNLTFIRAFDSLPSSVKESLCSAIFKKDLKTICEINEFSLSCIIYLHIIVKTLLPSSQSWWLKTETSSIKEKSAFTSLIENMVFLASDKNEISKNANLSSTAFLFANLLSYFLKGVYLNALDLSYGMYSPLCSNVDCCHCGNIDSRSKNTASAEKSSPCITFPFPLDVVLFEKTVRQFDLCLEKIRNIMNDKMHNCKLLPFIYLTTLALSTILADRNVCDDDLNEFLNRVHPASLKLMTEAISFCIESEQYDTLFSLTAEWLSLLMKLRENMQIKCDDCINIRKSLMKFANFMFSFSHSKKILSSAWDKDHSLLSKYKTNDYKLYPLEENQAKWSLPYLCRYNLFRICVICVKYTAEKETFLLQLLKCIIDTNFSEFFLNFYFFFIHELIPLLSAFSSESVLVCFRSLLEAISKWRRDKKISIRLLKFVPMFLKHVRSSQLASEQLFSDEMKNVISFLNGFWLVAFPIQTTSYILSEMKICVVELCLSIFRNLELYDLEFFSGENTEKRSLIDLLLDTVLIYPEYHVRSKFIRNLNPLLTAVRKRQNPEEFVVFVERLFETLKTVCLRENNNAYKLSLAELTISVGGCDMYCLKYALFYLCTYFVQNIFDISDVRLIQMRLKQNYDFNNDRQLCLPTLLEMWLQSKDLQTFPYTIFDFSSLKCFVTSNVNSIFRIYLRFKRSTEIERLCDLLKFTKSKILYFAFPSIFPYLNPFICETGCDFDFVESIYKRLLKHSSGENIDVCFYACNLFMKAIEVSYFDVPVVRNLSTDSFFKVIQFIENRLLNSKSSLVRSLLSCHNEGLNLCYTVSRNLTSPDFLFNCQNLNVLHALAETLVSHATECKVEDTNILVFYLRLFLNSCCVFLKKNFCKLCDNEKLSNSCYYELCLCIIRKVIEFGLGVKSENYVFLINKVFETITLLEEISNGNETNFCQIRSIYERLLETVKEDNHHVMYYKALSLKAFDGADYETALKTLTRRRFLSCYPSSDVTTLLSIIASETHSCCQSSQYYDSALSVLLYSLKTYHLSSQPTDVINLLKQLCFKHASLGNCTCEQYLVVSSHPYVICRSIGWYSAIQWKRNFLSYMLKAFETTGYMIDAGDTFLKVCKSTQLSEAAALIHPSFCFVTKNRLFTPEQVAEYDVHNLLTFLKEIADKPIELEGCKWCCSMTAKLISAYFSETSFWCEITAFSVNDFTLSCFLFPLVIHEILVTNAHNNELKSTISSWFETIIHQCEKCRNSSLMYKEVYCLIIQTVLYLRAQNCVSDKCLPNDICLNLDLMGFASAALYCGMPYSSLLFFALWENDQRKTQKKCSNEILSHLDPKLINIFLKASLMVSCYEDLNAFDVEHLLEPTNRSLVLRMRNRWQDMLLHCDITDGSDHNPLFFRCLQNCGLFTLEIPSQQMMEAASRCTEWFDFNDYNQDKVISNLVCGFDELIQNVKKDLIDCCSVFREFDNKLLSDVQFIDVTNHKELETYIFRNHVSSFAHDLLHLIKDECQGSALENFVRKQISFHEQFDCSPFPIINAMALCECALLKCVPENRTSIYLAFRNLFRRCIREKQLMLSERYLSDMQNYLSHEQFTLHEAELIWEKDEKEFALSLLKSLLFSKNGKISSNPYVHIDTLNNFIRWVDETKLESSNVVIHTLQCAAKHYEKSVGKIDMERVGNLYLALAKFTHQQYLKSSENMNSPFFEEKQNLLIEYEKEYNRINKIDPSSRYCRTLHRNLILDKKELERSAEETQALACEALEAFLRSLKISSDLLSIFDVISLWFRNCSNPQINDLIRAHISEIPSYKFVPSVRQLIAQMSTSDDPFTKLVRDLLFRCASDHPHHVLHILMATVNSYRDSSFSGASFIPPDKERIDGVIKLTNALKQSMNEHIVQLSTLLNGYIELANLNVETCRKRLDEIPIPKSKYSLTRIKALSLVAVPTISLPVRSDARYSNIISVVSFRRSFSLVGGLNLPKVIYCLCSDGRYVRQLVKGKDDLRQDALIQQVFAVMNEMLLKEELTKHQKLSIRCYCIVPLTKRSGIVEWCDNTISFGSYLIGENGSHERHYPNDYKHLHCRKLMESTQYKSNEEKFAVYKRICENFHPVFRHFFFEHYLEPWIWYSRKDSYIRSVAASSIAGHILGLGDRHVQNILIDKNTAEFIHIDLGIAFEQGRILPIPETVPFRLTRDVVDGMGICGTAGLFKQCCVSVLKIFRENREIFSTIIRVLLHDPHCDWYVSPLKVCLLQGNKSGSDYMNSEIPSSNETVGDISNVQQTNKIAERVLMHITKKLSGQEKNCILSCVSQVNLLIDEATDPINLCRMFCGWQPFL